MKKNYSFIIPALLVILTLLPLQGLAQDIFYPLTNLPQVESSFISGRFSHNHRYWYSQYNDHSLNLTDGFSSLYAYTCPTAESVSLAEEILNAYIKSQTDIELVMRNTSNHSDYRIYEKFDKDDKLVQLVIWNKEAANVCEVVVINWDKGYAKKSKTEGYNQNGLEFLNLAGLENLGLPEGIYLTEDYTIISSREAGKQAEQIRKDAHQARKQALRQAKQARKQALKQADQARKQALKQADQARKQALKQAEQARQQALKQAGQARKQLAYY